MAHTDNHPLGIASRRMRDEADAVLEQMFAYFTREDAPRRAEITRSAA